MTHHSTNKHVSHTFLGLISKCSEILLSCDGCQLTHVCRRRVVRGGLSEQNKQKWNLCWFDLYKVWPLINLFVGRDGNKPQAWTLQSQGLDYAKLPISRPLNAAVPAEKPIEPDAGDCAVRLVCQETLPFKRWYRIIWKECINELVVQHLPRGIL